MNKYRVEPKVDELTKNGRIYPRDVVKNAIENFKEGNPYSLGEIGQSFGNREDPSVIDLQKVSHITRDIYIDENNDIICEIEFLNNYESLEEIEPKFGLRSFGKINENNEVYDLKIETVDLIGLKNKEDINKEEVDSFLIFGDTFKIE